MSPYQVGPCRPCNLLQAGNHRFRTLSHVTSMLPTDSRENAVTSNTRSLHAWIMVRGLERDLKDLIFIEPTTGRRFEISNAPYLGIEAIWNHTNYWVNMQDSSSPIQNLDFNISDVALWESIFLSPSGQNPSCAFSALCSLGELSVQESKSKTTLKPAISPFGNGNGVLDMPPSWVLKLDLTRNCVRLRFPPDGNRTLFYQQSKLELFAGVTVTCAIQIR